jgi:hypothetical protein
MPGNAGSRTPTTPHTIMARYEKPNLHEYIAALHQRGYIVKFRQSMITDIPTRPAQYVRTVLLYRDGRLAFEADGFSYYKLLAQALEVVKFTEGGDE